MGARGGGWFFMYLGMMRQERHHGRLAHAGQPDEAAGQAPRGVVGMAALMAVGLVIMLYGLLSALSAI